MTIYAKGMNVQDLRERIGHTFEGECHLTSEEAELLFAVYEAAVDAYNDHDEAEIKRMTTSIRELYAAVDAARKAGT